MRTTTIVTLSIALTTAFSSCKKDITDPPASTTYPNFSQLKAGNYWIYERFDVDSAGNATATGITDSCYVEKDTMINNTRYFKVIRPAIAGTIYNDKFVRDSLHYIVNHLGQILFSSQNFTDTFYHYFITAGPADTVCAVVVKMADKNYLLNTPAGPFQTQSFKQSFAMYPKWSSQGNPRNVDTRYAENVGIVSETFPFYASNPNYIERRLVRYKVD
ncbi:MAG: hypothetical protein K1X61_03230 [Chitinophagales bacterium]|nr:hypothetical protein [Chitinophagales bacterium]